MNTFTKGKAEKVITVKDVPVGVAFTYNYVGEDRLYMKTNGQDVNLRGRTCISLEGEIAGMFCHFTGSEVVEIYDCKIHISPKE